MDGRCSTARRAKVVAQRLKAEINARRRWSNAELDELQRTATAVVLAEEAQRRALQGAGLDVDNLLAADKVRLDLACWTSLAIENLQASILAGRCVEGSELERATVALNAILPVAKTTSLNVHYVDGFICPKCKADTTVEAAVAAKAEAEAPAPQPVAAPVSPATPAPAPATPVATNVTPLRQPPGIHSLPNAPLKRDDIHWQ